ncbi:MAG: DUF4912 domain-containing protein [Planctomycetota bacterium]
MTPEKLRTHTAKELGHMARDRGVAGWHGMRKSELIQALASMGVKKPATPRNGVAKPQPKTPDPPKRRPTAAEQRLERWRHERQRLKDLANRPDSEGDAADRLLVMVRDPYWLHVSWEITASSVARARTALAQDWHAAEPVLRIVRLGDDGAQAGVRQLAIHGGVSHWYAPVDAPPSRFRCEIGYATPSNANRDGTFYCLARSNEVVTPEPNLAESIDPNWDDVARNADRVYAMSGGYSPGGASRELREALEARLRRPLGRPSETRFVTPGPATEGGPAMAIEVDAELIVHGSAPPHAHLTIQGEPVEVEPDGSFAVKLPLPERRQVIPVVASSSDGRHQKTVVLGVERNTRALEPRRRDAAG